MNNLSPIEYYTYMYPQLTLPIREGMCQSDEYINITKRLIFPDNYDFPLKETGREERLSIDTPAGTAEVLYLPDREIFDRFVQVLVYRCEPVRVPETTGAMLISGINNLRKYLEGNADYKDTVILLSEGGYSNVDYKVVGFERDKWLETSKIIRLYHELTHFVCRRMFIEHKEVIRDEVIADCIGIIAALGHYDSSLAGLFLGIVKSADGHVTCEKTGRLINYIEGSIDKHSEEADRLINVLEEQYENNKGISPFDFLLKLEREYIK